MRDTGIVIRTAFNNQMWQGCCKYPRNDPRCWQCVEGRLDVGLSKELQSRMGTDERGFCLFIAGKSGIGPPQWGGSIKAGQRILIPCVEAELCTESKYYWENFRSQFSQRARLGQVVFFVFKESDRRSYTLWGRSEVKTIPADFMGQGRKRIYFKPFKPLPKWVPGLPDVNLVGAPWLRGTYRYIDSERVAFLNGLISGRSSGEAY